METVDEVIERYASSWELPIEEQSTIDRIIELLAGSARHWSKDSWSKEKEEDLLKVVNEKQYKGRDLDVMLSLYDVLINDSQNALPYGIQAFEAFGRDPKKILQLENPDRLVEYVIDTAESLEELVGLKNRIIIDGQFGGMEEYRGVSSVTKRLANSLLLVANEIAYRLKDVDIRNLTEEESKAMEWEELGEKWFKPWSIRLEAHGAIVMAYQAKGESVVNKEALEALAAYESLTGRYQTVSAYTNFSMGLMEAYARIKYGADKLSTGEVPEELKADPDKLRNSAFSGMPDWDQLIRHWLFGSKEPEWEKRERQRAQQRTQSGRFQAEQPYRVIRDPWSDYSEELQLLGLTDNMSYEQARAAFRGKIKKQRLAFTHEIIGTQEYDSATKNAARILDAWNKVQPLYLQNQKPQSL